MTRAAQLAGLGSLEGSAPAYACRAWVNFNGTGTVAIRASGNVSSITDITTGQFAVNFTSAMPDANYSVTGSTAGASNSWSGTTYFTGDGDNTAKTASSTRVGTRDQYNNAWIDSNSVSVAIFR